MLSGQYDILVDNMWLTDILAIILLLIPIFLLFMDGKWIFFFYTISIVANLPLVFNMAFNFSYEAIIGFVIVVIIIKEIIRYKVFRYQTTKENIYLTFMLLGILGLNLLISIFHLNKDEFLLRFFIYIVNIFVLVIYTYFFSTSSNLKFIKNGFIIGAIILVFSMIVEMIYGHYYLNIRNMRPAGLLLDPNVCAFTLNLALVLSFIERKKNIFVFDLLFVAARVLILFGIFLTVSRSAYIGTIFIIIALAINYSKGKNSWLAPTVVIVLIGFYVIFNNIIMNFIDNIYKIIDLGRIFPKTDYVPPPPVGDGGGGSGGIDGNIDYSNSRLLLIRAAFYVFSNNFITGVGIGNVTREISILTDLEMNAHNLYLQLIAESGIIMLLTLLFFSYYVIVYIFRIEKKYKFIILLLFGIIFIESMFNHNLLNINIIYLVFAFILGLAMLSSKDRRVYVVGKDSFKLRKSRVK